MLKNAFFAIFSSTKNWKKFRGTGYINAEDIENQLAPLQSEIADKKIMPEKGLKISPELSFKQKQFIKRGKRKKKSELHKFLTKYSVRGVDKSKGLKDQKFTEIQMEGGSEDSSQFFARVTKKQ